MTIAVDIRSGKAYPENYERFIGQLFQHLALLQPEHRFIFFINKPDDKNVIFSHNVLPFVLPFGTSFFSDLRQGIAVAKALKKYNADVFAGHCNVISLTCSVPLVILTSQVNNPDNLAVQHRKWLHRKIRTLCLRKADVIAVPHSFLQEEFVKSYKKRPGHIVVTGIAVSETFKPLDWQQKQVVKDEYTDGCEYFLFPAGQHHPDFINLLKAFSVFKKWQRSNLKLVVTGSRITRSGKSVDKLANYKYRNEVVIADVDEAAMADVIAAAYALVFPGNNEDFSLLIAQAMQCSVLVITSANSSMAGMPGEAALYADLASTADTAGQMKLIYKDEARRTELVKAAAKQAQMLDWHAATIKMWNALELAVSK